MMQKAAAAPNGFQSTKFTGFSSLRNPVATRTDYREVMETEISFSEGPNLPACETSPEECKLSLLLERTKCGNAVVLRCRGRIVYRGEAVVLSRAVSELLEHNRHIVLDLSGVCAIDSAGLGELVALHMWAQGNGSCLKLTGLSSRIFHLLELTNLTSLFEIFSTEKAALESWQEVA